MILPLRNQSNSHSHHNSMQIEQPLHRPKPQKYGYHQDISEKYNQLEKFERIKVFNNSYLSKATQIAN